MAENDTMSISIHIAKPEMVDVVWSEVQELLKLAVDESLDLDMGNIKARIEDTSMMLVAVIRDRVIIAASVLELLSYPTGKNVLGVVALGGEDAPSWVAELDKTLQGIAINLNCSELRIAGRPGWAKLLKGINWKTKYTVLSKPVGEV